MAQRYHLDPAGIRDYARDLDKVWGDFADEDVIEQTKEIVRRMESLADRIEKGE